MIFGIGIDIVEINRIKKSIEKNGDVFLRKIFSEKEIILCKKNKVNPYCHYAGRFASKEAVFKALSGVKSLSIGWKDVEILREPSGKPYLFFSSAIKKILDENEISSYHISISHSDKYAVSQVILETRP